MTSAPASSSSGDETVEAGIERHLAGDLPQQAGLGRQQVPLVEVADPAPDPPGLVLGRDLAPARVGEALEQMDADVAGADGPVEVEEHGRRGEIEGHRHRSIVPATALPDRAQARLRSISSSATVISDARSSTGAPSASRT